VVLQVQAECDGFLTVVGRPAPFVVANPARPACGHRSPGIAPPVAAAQKPMSASPRLELYRNG